MGSSKRDRPASPESSSSDDVMLPVAFTPSNRDVVCGRSKRNYLHDGNKYFREFVAVNVQRYLSARSKIDKSCVILSIVEDIRGASPHGGFVRQDPATKAWYTVGDSAAREKVGATLRSIIKSAGGEKTLLSQLVRHDNECKAPPKLQSDPLLDWVPQNISGDALDRHRNEDEFSLLVTGDTFAVQPENSLLDSSFWKTMGIDVEPEELNWLLDAVEWETQPQLSASSFRKDSKYHFEADEIEAANYDGFNDELNDFPSE